MELLAGTSGFSYDAWKGSFYPEDLPAKQRLRFYAERLPAVEINNTFYRMPRASVLEGWAAQVPTHFRFVLKASRRITHFKRLVEVGEETDYLVRTASVLGERLGALLFQLPPNLRADPGRLEAFLDALPPEVPAAFEFRHASWEDEPIAALLRAHGRPRVASEDDETPLGALAGDGPFLYLRLRRSGYAPAELAERGERIAASGAPRAFVFFKHEDAGEGPRLARALLELAEARRARPASRSAPARGRRRA